MNNNPFALIMQLMQSGGDPRQMLINLLSRQQNLGPFGENLLRMAQSNDLSGATNITKNAANERGMNFDQTANDLEKQISPFIRR